MGLDLWYSLILPLGRLLVGLALGMFIASFLEALGWTNFIARLAFPLTRLANFGSIASSAFGLAFASPAVANSFLSENYEAGKINFKELLLANLFNSLPGWLTHLPTLFFLLWPALGVAALVYAGLLLLAVIGRTFFTIILGRILLPPIQSSQPAHLNETKKSLKNCLLKAAKRLRKRLPRLFLFTAPIYFLMWIGQQTGVFPGMQTWLSQHLTWLSFFKPEALSIIVLQLIAEMGATLGAAGAALQSGGLTSREIILAMLTGAIIATPIRALRHQLPAYVGFYKLRIGIKLLITTQAVRTISLIIITILYWFF